MRRVLIVSVTAAFTALALVSLASAHNTRWHWSGGAAEATLENEGLYFDRTGYETVFYADCYGRGHWIWNNAGNRRLFKHFNCYVESDVDDPYWIRFHVQGKYRWDYNFLYYD